MITAFMVSTLQLPNAFAEVVGSSEALVGSSDDAYTEIPGLSGFYFWDIRNSATVELSNTYDRRSGESQALYGDNAYGSLKYSMTDGSDKAGIAHVLSSPIAFGDYTGGSFDWYRASLSDNPPAQSPAFFLTVDVDGDLGTDDDRFGLKYEAVYNGVSSPVPVDSWETAMISGTTNLWSWNAPEVGDRFVFNITLDDWKTEYPDAVITIFGIDSGSGWNGIFEGAIDLIVLDYGSESLAFDFELLPSFRPDLTVGFRLNENSHKGDNIYKSTVTAGQRVSHMNAFNESATSYFAVENDGNRTDTIEFRASGIRNKDIKTNVYKIVGGKFRNVSGLALRGGVLSILNPSESVKFKSVMKLTRSAKNKVRRRGRLVKFEQKYRVKSMLEGSKLDFASSRVHFK